jgi:hypothetical protein
MMTTEYRIDPAIQNLAHSKNATRVTEQPIGNKWDDKRWDDKQLALRKRGNTKTVDSKPARNYTNEHTMEKSKSQLHSDPNRNTQVEHSVFACNTYSTNGLQHEK